jgi:uncharacterized protein YebE (UPF0316 family)
MEHLLDRLDSVPFLLPIIIMFSRIVDVSIGTTRIIMVIRGKRLTAAVLGFFEVTTWLIAITAIISRINNWYLVIFYGIGFALGNVVGMFIENFMAIGQQVVRFISPEEGEGITRTLRNKGFGVTEVVASGREGPVGFGFVIASRKMMPTVISIISGVDPRAVVTIEDVRYSNIVEYYQPVSRFNWWNVFKKK